MSRLARPTQPRVDGTAHEKEMNHKAEENQDMLGRNSIQELNVRSRKIFRRRFAWRVVIVCVGSVITTTLTSDYAMSYAENTLEAKQP